MELTFEIEEEDPERVRQETLGRLDIAVEALSILSSATQAAAAILERRRALDESGQADRPLLVLLGEKHSNPAHIAHHLAVLDRVHAAEPATVFLKELPHNIGTDRLNALFAERTGRPVTAAARQAIRDRDTDGHLSLATLTQEHLMVYAPHSHDLLNQALLRRDIPVAFTDAAQKSIYQDLFLDPDDPATNDSLRASGSDMSVLTPGASPQGMHARNHHMLLNAASFAQENRARIAFQQCGTYHVTGRPGCDPAHDLSGLSRSMDIPAFALPVTDTAKGEEQSRLSARLSAMEPGEYREVRGLPTHEALYDPRYNASFGLFHSREEESDYINNILNVMDMQADGMTAGEFRLKRAFNARALHEAIDEVAASLPAEPQDEKPEWLTETGIWPQADFKM